MISHNLVSKDGGEQVVNSPGMNFIAVMPLLRSPFTNAVRIAVVYPESNWSAACTASSFTSEITNQIIATRIGGAFWRPETLLPRGMFDVVVLPSALKTARRFWRIVLATKFAENLLVILPQGRRFAALAAEIGTAGAAFVTAGNPHTVLDIARSVHAAGRCDLTILAELAGRPVFYHQTGGGVAPLKGEAVAWVTDGTAYRNPYTGEPASCAETVELLADWQRVFSRNRNIAVCAGMSMWKRRRIEQLLHTGQAGPAFRCTTGATLRLARQRGGAIAAWSTRLPNGLAAAAARQNIALLRVEDGFIRSAGLGSNLAPPASIIVDQAGIYFDPSQPSDLENLIAKTAFSEALILRAQQLIALLLAGGISKYAAGWQLSVLDVKPDQRIILVPGQVADDLSVQLGAHGAVRTNAALLAAVRARNPEAFIVYRPHPDVVAGHRQGAIADPVASGLADQLNTEGTIAALLDSVDEVHTMTSLTGFEALLRGCVVETYGQPFYANWGLTTDHMPMPRRQRRISIAELVAATLILYPLYVDPQTGLPCGPEILVGRLQQSELWQPGLLMRLHRWLGQTRQAWRGACPARRLLNA